MSPHTSNGRSRSCEGEDVTDESRRRTTRPLIYGSKDEGRGVSRADRHRLPRSTADDERVRRDVSGSKSILGRHAEARRAGRRHGPKGRRASSHTSANPVVLEMFSGRSSAEPAAGPGGIPGAPRGHRDSTVKSHAGAITRRSTAGFGQRASSSSRARVRIRETGARGFPRAVRRRGLP
jgi:hypothetical protein